MPEYRKIIKCRPIGNGKPKPKPKAEIIGDYRKVKNIRSIHKGKRGPQKSHTKTEKRIRQLQGLTLRNIKRLNKSLWKVGGYNPMKDKFICKCQHNKMVLTRRARGDYTHKWPFKK